MVTVEPIRDLRKIAAIKRSLKRSNPRDYLLFVLGINTALRIGDILALRVRDVGDENGRPKEVLSLTERKTHKTRRILLNEAARDAIAFYVDSVSPDLDDPLFPSPRTGNALLTPLIKTAARWSI